MRIGLALTGAQLGVLMAVVVALLTSVHLAEQRAELGLQRLRGQPAGQLRRLVIGRWAAVTIAGGLLGWLPAAVALTVVGDRLPGRPEFPIGPVQVAAVVLAQLIIIAMIIPGVRALLAQPVIEMTRSVSAVRAGQARQLIIDVALLVLAACGLAAATQTGGSSLLGLLAPSLLAIGLAIVLVRVVIGSATVLRRRLITRLQRPAALLTMIIVLRLRGLRILIITATLATAFVIFVGQLAGIGEQVRRHDAEVRTGSAAVLTVSGDLETISAAVAGLDPGHAGPAAELTPVVITRRADERALQRHVRRTRRLRPRRVRCGAGRRIGRTGPISTPPGPNRSPSPGPAWTWISRPIRTGETVEAGATAADPPDRRPDRRRNPALESPSGRHPSRRDLRSASGSPSTAPKAAGCSGSMSFRKG